MFPFRVVRGVTIDETHLRFNVLAASSAMRLRQCERHDVRRSDIRLRAPFRSLACRIEASNRRPDEIRRDASARRQNESSAFLAFLRPFSTRWTASRSIRETNPDRIPLRRSPVEQARNRRD
jgi:hypothetical protein